MKSVTFAILFNMFCLSLHANQGIDCEIINDEHPWPSYAIGWENITFNVRFPTSPSITEANGNITLLSIDTSTFPIVAYGLTYSLEVRIEDPEELYEDYISQFDSSRHVLINSNINVEEDMGILDFFSVDTKQHIGKKERIIVTADNVFYLTTISFYNTVDNHEAFINSFIIN
jgi:hypothetical protein